MNKHEKIQEQIEEYIKSGGKITVLPRGPDHFEKDDLDELEQELELLLKELNKCNIHNRNKLQRRRQ